MVLDASVAIELLLGTDAGRRIAGRIRSPEFVLSAPQLIDLEVAQALRRYAMSEEISFNRARMALEHLSQLDLHRYGHQVLLPRIWELRHNLTAYDAAYVALAEGLEVPLWTRDRKLAAFEAATIPIELV